MSSIHGMGWGGEDNKGFVASHHGSSMHVIMYGDSRGLNREPEVLSLNPEHVLDLKYDVRYLLFALHPTSI